LNNTSLEAFNAGAAVNPRSQRKKEKLERVRIGISSCLLGERVRFDGGHKRDAFLADMFGRHVEWVPVCPEFEIGLGVPRETLRLVVNDGRVRLVAPRTGADHTDRMKSWAEHRIEQLAKLDLCGYVFKRASPSCGLQRVKVYRNTGLLHRDGIGLYASAVIERFANLPVEEEGRLNNPRLRENFVSCVFSYKRWLDFGTRRPTRAAVMRFHARHKFLLMAHSQAGVRTLGNLVAAGTEYFVAFCEVMRRIPTRRNHTNVLQHLSGYFSKQLDSSDRAELAELIESYRRGLLPLIVPVTLIRHYVRKYEVTYLEDQIYLNPHPDELMLLNEL
jgi:uncharacterized protein YbgA (DUF1722 family)/uncharacterized protein YbbK (DUF523 family)